MKAGDDGFMWFRLDRECWRVRHVRVVRVTERGTLIARDSDTGKQCETSGLYIYRHRWACIGSVPVPHGEVKESGQ